MSATRRKTLLLAILIAMLGLIAIGSYQRMTSQAERARRVHEQTRRSILLAREIHRLRDRSARPGAASGQDVSIASALERSAEAAGAAPDRVIQSIRPQPAQRIEGAAWRRKRTEIRLDDLTLRQTVVMLRRLIEEQPGLHVESLRLSDPKGNGPAAKWRADPVVLVALVPAREGDANEGRSITITGP